MSHVYAPFTEDQVASINAYQKSGVFHPFTCGCGDCRAVLRANTHGMVCDACHGWTQKWVHKFMADWSWKGGQGRV